MSEATNVLLAPCGVGFDGSQVSPPESQPWV